MITFIQLTDTHIQAEDRDRFFGRDTMQSLRDTFAALRVCGLTPAYPVLISGDLTNNGEPAAYARLRAVVDEQRADGVTVLLTLGNHDDRAAFRRAGLFDGRKADVPEPAEAVAPEGEKRINARHMLGGLRLLLLDTHIPGAHDGDLGAAQLAWLADELAAPAPEGTILVLHHPPEFSSFVTQEVHAIGDADALRGLIVGSDVIGILAGHVHVHTVSVFAGVPCVAAPGTAFLLDPFARGGMRFLDGGGFHVVTVADRQMTVRQIPAPGTGAELAFLTEAQMRAPGRAPGSFPAPVPARSPSTPL